MLIIAKNKINFDQLKKVKLPEASQTFTPIPHAHLVTEARKAIETAGLTIAEEEHAIARDGLRYFGGFALTGQDITGTDRKLVFGLRNSGDKSFAASVCLGTSMMVCENLAFSSNIKLARRHTTNIFADLPRVLAEAVSRVTTHWVNTTNRIEAYKQAEIDEQQAADLLVKLVDSKALPAREIYNVVKEFRAPRHAEFKGETLWNLYNGVTEHLKGSDLTKLPQRTMVMESLFDRVTNFKARDLALVS